MYSFILVWSVQIYSFFKNVLKKTRYMTHLNNHIGIWFKYLPLIPQYYKLKLFQIMKAFFFSIIISLFSIISLAQNSSNDLINKKIPSVYSGIQSNENGELYFISIATFDTAWMNNKPTYYTLDSIRINPIGTEKGLLFDFKNKDFYGTINYGLYPKNNNVKFSQPVYYKNKSRIINGKAEVDISKLNGKYDIAKWEKYGKARVGYRISDNYGNIIYDGVIDIAGKSPFKLNPSIVAGPYINIITDSSVVISYETNIITDSYIEINDIRYFDNNESKNGLAHEILINNLQPNTKYKYRVTCGDSHLTYSFKTAPPYGSKSPFTFAYTSDSRAGNGGGERNIHGVNAYIMKRMAVLASYENAHFFQFTGDMINGYSSSIGQTKLEYANWKKAVEPYWHYIPFNIGAGNHEALVNVFDNNSKYGISIDKFPFTTSSTEKVFSDNFVNPKNGPISEDGAYYDPHNNKLDFPKYGETVFYYTYGNTAIIVLNSNYWYTPSTKMIPEIGGNPHGYIMDNQLIWFENTIAELNNNALIDNIFVTIHTPAFPNGGHAGDDMWYNGNNKIRPTVAGIPVKKGIIERRDEFLDIMINKSNKVVALLCGDEHNYSRMKLTKKTQIYPDNHKGKKLRISRPFWQITNGSAGAPYYGQQELPWSNSVEKFSTQYALMLFDIEGTKVRLRVINPDTLEEIETIILKQSEAN